ncbi:sn-glycerol-3-phosphate ABC transporter ATP-binding protein UgpC [Devosia rhodophyticola]|uniref:Sn-glycerol-3-phosphate ABC transporter ATP-binding protein UgpC n=1 Tax=Devosia rhodophyticola TaxID=3026423 RepID=A0ABY7YYF0_9HYPH|nr:sn-glycerol-3-phosphate ABC transporter ATP-binding protein UgpC [Devosia rhodophyticola]WDR06425.1 sn-glycerol-3-phosphate ABC transporter ATP-binding protein UgpC [Devosia rhodophyticola]
MAQMNFVGAGKSYGTTRVVEKLDLEVEDGSFTVFVGPSGCGKSTLLRMIAGIEEISEGDLLIDGVQMGDATPVERGIAMVFQNYALYPHMSVEKNIGFGLKMANMSKAEIDKRVAQAADILKIEPLLKRKPGQLSGGQRQRVAIGRAIVREPKLFLFDEPLSNLDAELRVEMRVEIAKLHRALAATMIYVTHDQTEAMTLADKIVVLRAGKIEQQGTPVQLYDDPENLFVAGFIGSPRMNFLRGKVKLASDGTASATLAAGGTVDFGAIDPAGWVDGEEISVGIRPEQFHYEGAGDIRLPVNVDVVENMGGAYFIHAQTQSDELVVCERRGGALPAAGDALEVGFNRADLRMFAANGQRLRLRAAQ